MSEDHNNDNEDIDLEDVEHRLYAAIHHESDYTKLTETAEADPNGATSENFPDRRLSNNDGQRKFQQLRNTKRYWNVDSAASSTPLPAYNDKQLRNERSPFVAKEKPAALLASNTPSTSKVFTPYVSVLFSHSDDIDQTATAPLKETNKLLQTASPSNNINPFSKKQVVKQFKEPIQADAAVRKDGNSSNDEQIAKARKRVNPFANQQQKPKKEKKTASKDRHGKDKDKNQRNDSACIIDLDETIEDDDVIILPSVEPPLICVDSSDDEVSRADEHEFAEPATRAGDCRKTKATGSRCASPSSSVQSADDFIAQQDRQNINFDANLSYDDLYSGNETVADSLRQSNTHEPSTSKSMFTATNDSSVFTAPKTMTPDKSKETQRKSYEVSDNSFVAVDVYESESSDMPESIYAKGTLKRKYSIHSDSSDVEEINVFKPKKLKKRKHSGSAKEMSDDSSSDLPSEDTANDDDSDENGDGDSYLVRGEALGKVRKSNKAKRKSRKKSCAKSSDDEFMMKLTSIVNDGSLSDDEDDGHEQDPETSAESVDARHIVETVLERRTKRLKSNSNKTGTSGSAKVTEKPSQSDKETPKSSQEMSTTSVGSMIPAIGGEQIDNASQTDKSQWTVTDEVGQTDDLPAFPGFVEETPEEGNNVLSVEPSNMPPTQLPQQSTSEPALPFIPLVSPNSATEQNMNDEELDAEAGWNDEMKRFYNDSWGGETFSVRNIHARMPKGILNWRVANRDKYGYSNRKNPNIICLNCQERGHKAAQCNRPRAKKQCSMCGDIGHSQGKCPNKVCLLCGRRMSSFAFGCHECNRDRGRACFLCKGKGHLQAACPDHWRRYHAITRVEQTLEETRPNSTKNKPKYCASCSRRGHLADQCQNAKFPMSTTSVASYRQLYNINNASQYMHQEKFTILSSTIGDYTFSLGDVALDKANRIYSRFRQAVNLQDTHSEQSDSISFDKTIEILESSRNEYNSADSSSIDFETSAILDASQWLPNALFDQNTVEIADTSAQSNTLEISDLSDSMQQQIDVDEIKTAEKDPAALENWERKLQVLDRLREQILIAPTKPKLISPTTHHNDKDESDSNYSFSEHFNASPQKSVDAVSTTDIMPDFIPLPESHERARSQSPSRSRSQCQSPVSADTTTDSLGDPNSDATMHLTQAHCNHLIKPHGSEALRELQTKNSVTVEMEWHQMGNVLRIRGTPENQDNFHKDLSAFLSTLLETTNITSNNTMFRVPKQKPLMVSYLREHLRLLEAPSYFNRDIRKVYRKMLDALAQNNKKGIKEANRCRRILNTIIFGRHGFGDGEMHLMGLQDLLATLLKTKSFKLTKQQVGDLGKHFEYIFTEFDHKNYPDLIDQYYNMKEAKTLRVLKIDRQLLGFNINVNPTIAPKRTSNAPDDALPAITSTQINIMPSSHEIQLNVSNSSTKC